MTVAAAVSFKAASSFSSIVNNGIRRLLDFCRLEFLWLGLLTLDARRCTHRK
jgi:hypothetical protein